MVAVLRQVALPETDAANASTPGAARSTASETGGSALSDKPRITVDILEVRANRLPTEVDLEQLYPASAELNTKLSQALILLSQALQRLDRAVEYVRSGEVVLADDQVHHLLTLLEECFCLRDLGEGLANLVNACVNAIRNQGAITEERQLLGINACLLALKKKPLLSFDASLEFIDRLEVTGLDVDTLGIKNVVEWLVDESPN
jgi:hypothetical protein